ncbi:hypothetical protein J3D48_006301 [Pseudomonas fluorescens]|uniref:Tc toxin subunit A-related protein n=1 Tax=Pseudomonas fluorescens TaxID=294 RepID=UPI00209FE193|nr:neuraminidase-like domain-containing protein [Pseudomonas fluorescens]MCP1489891.1 hypothetical protein [Pseudomonas fluorescens]
MTNSIALNAIQTARRDALVDYYTAYCIPQAKLADGTALDRHVRTAEELYEYLLLDTKIGPEVMTSRVGEAISSLQLYINRCLGGIDPDVNNSVDSRMVKESQKNGFLYDWPDYNQAFSTWAGKKRLQYYPSTYLNPQLRYNKTELFKALEDSINQAQISDSRVEKAFQQYILGFETLANLETISGYQAGNDPSPTTRDTFYFIGRSKNSPYSYYWRRCDMAIRDDLGALTAGAWSQWLKITAPTEEALDSLIKPCWFENRLYICWISTQTNDMTIVNNVKTTTSNYYSNIWYLQEDGVWAPYTKTPLNEEPLNFGLFDDILTKKMRFAYNVFGLTVLLSDLGVSMLGSKPKVGDNLQVSSPKIFARVLELSNTDMLLTVEYHGTTTTTVNVSDCNIRYYKFDGSYTTVSVSVSSLMTILVSRLDDASICYAYITFQASYKGGSGLVSVPVFFKDDEFEANYRACSLEGGVLKFHSETPNQIILDSSAAPYFISTLQSEGIDGLLSYNLQTENIEFNATKPIDFNGPYGLYFWELFFHSVFLIAERYLTEQNYNRAEKWYRYIFSAAGYRTNGDLNTINGETRYWNVVPLQADQAWNASLPETVDPDAIAMNDPMQYKVAMFLRYVNALIDHGDNCYRMQQRDYMSQAKMYYIQASQMMGPRPDINYATGWSNPTVGAAVEALNPSASGVDLHSPTVLAQLYKTHVRDANGDFLPPYNDELLTYWDKLEVRLFNLRNNLTLDGQPLLLPLYATPVSPTDLQQQHSAGNGTGSVALPGNQLSSEFRFPVLMDKARTAVSSVIQFGGALQSALQQRDSEYMTLLVQTQQQQISTLTQALQVDNIASLSSSVDATTHALESAKMRLDTYTKLYTDGISYNEETAMDTRAVAAAAEIAAAIPEAVANFADVAPNVFGMADGGSRWGAPAKAVAVGLKAGATLLNAIAERTDISEQYRRRREDWELQKDTADFDVKQLTAQIQSQNQQLAMAQKQQDLYAQELSNWKAQYAMQSTRFTGLELFNWMAGRLSSLYYQLYDSALALCLTAKSALGREIGASNTTTLFTAPMWNDLYQGLLAGESLQVELQKMENTFLRLDQRGLEIQKTVSLNTQITRADSSHSFSGLLTGALQDAPLAATGGVTVQMLDADKLVIELAIDALGLNDAYGSNGKVGRFKNISVTLPALLGPYQDVEATLSLGAEVVALSRGLDDSGMFMVDFNAPKYLPFENDLTNTGTLVLTFYNAGANQLQRALVESLVDVIFQLRYTLKGH